MRFGVSVLASILGCCLALVLISGPAQAQFLGHEFTGDMGLMSGSQGPPGWNVAVMYLRYDGETLRGPDGESIAIDPYEWGFLDANSYAVTITWVAEKKIWGGTYGFGIFPALDELQLGRHRGYDFGPEVTLPIATKNKLIGFVNARFLWETGIRSRLEGTVFTLAVSLPNPSISL